jgi:hypothetical protein
LDSSSSRGGKWGRLTTRHQVRNRFQRLVVAPYRTVQPHT